MKMNRIELRGDYSNIYEFDENEPLFVETEKVMDVEEPEFFKLLKPLNSDVLVLKKYEDDFIIVGTSYNLKKLTHSTKYHSSGKLFSKVFPVLSKAGYKDLLLNANEEGTSFKTIIKLKDDFIAFNQVAYTYEEYYIVTSEKVELSGSDDDPLKEAHFNIKSNLQLLSSIINLEKRFKADKSQEVVDNIAARIKSLAFVHEKTHTSADYKNIQLEGYVQEEFKNLMDIYNYPIQLTTDIDDELTAPMTVVTKIALIFNELFTNTIKHAFPKKGMYERISIFIEEDGDNFIINYFDNGEGLPEFVTFDTSMTLGMNTIRLLTSQMEGTVEEVPCDGCGYRFTFPNSILKE